MRGRGLDTAGIYCRYFRDGPHTLWTLMLSFWYPAVLFAIFPGCYAIRQVRLGALPQKNTPAC